jgi:nucleoside 2-deoxyribosyltransferase
MAGHKVRVYCAGPLFNAKEKEEMEELAGCLEEAGFLTFLPQRDGLELTKVVETLIDKGIHTDMASAVASKAIFALDVYQVIEQCEAIVVNLNGRVPDEGAVSEAAIAWCSGKAVVGYKADTRSVFLGQDNPLVAGLFDFEICERRDEAVPALTRALARNRDKEERATRRSDQLKGYLELGHRIWDAAKSSDRVNRLTEVLYGEIACGPSKRTSRVAHSTV